MNKIIIFDLDDTLYKEIDFLKSAFKEIVDYTINNFNCSVENSSVLFSNMLEEYFSKRDAFDYLIKTTNVPLDKKSLLSLYRSHIPQISLSEGAYELLNKIQYKGYEIGIITDGRSTQQRNKITALGLDSIVNDKNIIISEEFGSEKPSIANYKYFIERYTEASEFYYIADNPKKDFLSPNRLGWMTICLKDNGRNIHKQQMDLPKEYLPKILVHSLMEIMEVL